MKVGLKPETNHSDKTLDQTHSSKRHLSADSGHTDVSTPVQLTRTTLFISSRFEPLTLLKKHN